MKIRGRPRARLALVGALGLLACLVAPARAADPVSWSSAIDGSWLDPANWGPNVVPNNGGGTTYAVTIGAAGAPYMVSLSDDIAVDSLTLNSSDATLRHDGGVFEVGAIDLQAGTYLMAGGTIKGATISQNGGALAFTGAPNVLDGATVVGDLAMASGYVRLANGAGFTGAAVVGAADGSSGVLGFEGDQTVAGKDVTLRGYGSQLAIEGGGTLTLDAATSVHTEGGGYATLGGNYYLAAGGTLVNQGSITSGAGYSLYFNPESLDNRGTIAADGGSVQIYSTNLANTGTLEARNGGALTIAATAWSNAGTIRVADSASSATLASDTTTAGLGTIDNSHGGALYLAATLDNAGADLAVDGATLGTLTMNGGTIRGGTVTPSNGGALAFTYGANVLDGATVVGDLAVASGYVRLVNGANFTGAAALGTMDASGGVLAFQGDRALAGKDVTLRGYGSYLAVEGDGLGGPGTLTLDAATTVHTEGNGYGFVGNNYYVSGDSTLVNEGSIVAGSGYTLYFNPTILDNRGTIAADGGSVQVTPATLANTGTLEARDGGALYLAPTAGPWSNAGTIRVADSASSATLGGETTTAGLGTVDNAHGGSLYLAGTIDNAGADLAIDGATLGTLTMNGGTIRGGAITPSNGGALAFTGSLNVLDGATLNGDLAVTNYGQVRLVHNADFTGNAVLGTTDGSGGTLAYLGDRNLVAKDITLRGYGSYLATEGDGLGGPGALTLDGATNLHTEGFGFAYLGSNYSTSVGSELVNQGSITAGSGYTLFFNPTDFVNQGTMDAQAGGTLYFTTSFTQAAGSFQLHGGDVYASMAMAFQGGELVGSGTIHGDVLNAVMVAPGFSPGTLSITGDLTNLDGASLRFEVGGPTPGADFDQILVGGTFTAAGDLHLAALGGFGAMISPTDTFTIVTANLPILGAFSNVANGAWLALDDGRGEFRVNYGAGSLFDPNLIVLSDFRTRDVPEPGSLALLGLGLGGLALYHRRRRKAGATTSA